MTRAASEDVIPGKAAISVGDPATEVPAGWVRVRLTEIARLESGHTPSRKHPEWWGGDVPWISLPDAREHHGGVIQETTQNTNELGLANSAARWLPKDTVCLSRTASVGYVFRLGRPMATSQDFVNWVCSEAIDPRYLQFALLAEGDHILAFGKGTTHTTIYFPEVLAFHVCLPPLAEQRRIVEKVEALLAQVNRARARLARVPAILKRFRQSILSAACSGRLTEAWRRSRKLEPIADVLRRLQFDQSHTGRAATEDSIVGQVLAVGDPQLPAPKGWKWVPLTEVARLESGHTPSRKHPEYWDGEIAWIGILDAGEHHGGRISKTRQTITPKGIENSAARLLPRNTVCLSRTASVGYVVIMDREMATSQDFVDWVCSEAIVPEFLMYAFMAEGDGIKKFGRGTTHTTIYFPEVKAPHICLPPVEEQKKIAQLAAHGLRLADSIEARVAAATARAARLTQAILSKAFRGELVPTEAELARQEGRDYEPASTLLARIHADRTANDEKSTRRPRAATTTPAPATTKPGRRKASG